MSTLTNTLIQFHRKKNSEENMVPNHVTEVVLQVRTKTKNAAAVLGPVIVMGNTAETRNANEAEVETDSEGVEAEIGVSVKEVEAEIERTGIAVARAKRDEGGHAQEITTLGRGHHLVLEEELEVE